MVLPWSSHTLSRRRLVGLLAGSAVLAASPTLMAACGSSTPSSVPAAPTVAAPAPTAKPAMATAAPAAAPTAAAKAPASGAVQITFSTWGAGGSAYSAEQKVVDAFNQAHSDIQAKVLQIDFGSYRDKVLTMLAGGDAPDNMAIDHDMFPFMVQKQVFTRLDPLVATDKSVLDDYFPSALDGMRFQGALYGIPTGGSAFYLYWSPKLFQEAGLPSPNELMAKGQWTWDAYVQAAQKLTKKDGSGKVTQFGANTGLDISSITPWVWTNGGGYLSDDQTHLLLDQPKSVEAVEFLHDLIWKHGVAPRPDSSEGAIQAFLSGRLAMHTTWGGTGMAQFLPAKELSWDMALPPAPDGKSFATWAPLNPMCIDRQAKHAEQSWTFERWYNGTPGMTIFSRNGRVPVARSVLNSPDYLKQPPPQHKEAVLAGMQVGKPAFSNPHWTEASDKLKGFLEDIHTNRKPAAEALKQAVATVNPILAG